MTEEELKSLVSEAMKRTARMTPEEREAMFKRQREGYAKAEASWPKAKFHWVNGTKVFESYEDYCND